MNSNKYLLDIEDGLPMRVGQQYAVYKLMALEAYLTIFLRSMRDKWPVINYIDLQSGPGKNRIENKIYLGSSLIAIQAALNLGKSFDHFWFNEKNEEDYRALLQRVKHANLPNSHIAWT